MRKVLTHSMRSHAQISLMNILQSYILIKYHSNEMTKRRMRKTLGKTKRQKKRI